jgi:hypothetical protein
MDVGQKKEICRWAGDRREVSVDGRETEERDLLMDVGQKRGIC